MDQLIFECQLVKQANRTGLVGRGAVSGEVTLEQRSERAEKGCFRQRAQHMQ